MADEILTPSENRASESDIAHSEGRTRGLPERRTCTALREDATAGGPGNPLHLVWFIRDTFIRDRYYSAR